MKKFCPTLFGFTLIELLVAISIIGILFGVGITSYNQFNRRQILEQTARNIKEDLRMAQSKALSGEKPTGCSGILHGYRVNFYSSNYTIFAICQNPIQIKNFTLPSGITFSSYPASILFKVLGQGVIITGATDITLSAFSQTRTITVTSSGEIN